MTKPFLRYAGGKTQLVPKLRRMMPDGFGTYFEPFVGGGALFFAVDPENAVINDINRVLMLTYKMVAQHPEEVMNEVLTYLAAFDEEQYYVLRALFNEMKGVVDGTTIKRKDAIQIASLYIYLNRTCFNGLYRENQAGENNVPVGKFRKGPTFDVRLFMRASEILRNAILMSRDFEEALDGAEAGDFVYFDPPYQHLKKQSFTAFTPTGFTADDQRRLARTVHDLSDRGVFILLSNSDTPLIRELYGDMLIHTVDERRNINSDTTNRGSIGAVIVANYGE